MAVTGVFNADFSQFFGAVTEANTKLDSLEANTTQTSAAVKGLETSFGASSVQLRAVGDAAASSAPQVNSLSDSYKQFDGALAAAGVHIGPQVKAIEDITAAATKSIGELGAFATAGLVVGTAMAAWDFGRAIAGFFQLDEKISKAAVSLGLFGDVAVETAGAKQDTINRAIAQGAAVTISYTDAIKFNIDAMAKHNAQKQDWTLTLAAAYKQVRDLTDAQKSDIAIMQEADATVKEITTKYGISELALKLLTDQTTKHAAEQSKAAKAVEEHRLEQEKLAKAAAAGLADFQAQTDVMNAWKPIIDENIKKRDAAAIATANQRAAEMQHAEATAAETKATTDYLTEQDRMTAENDAAVATLNAMAGAHTEAAAAATAGGQATAAAYAGVTQQVNISADAIRAWIGLMQYTNASNAILAQNSLYTTPSQRDQLARLPIPSFASGVENFDGGLAKVHAGELLVNLPGGTSVIPKGAGGSLTMSNTFNLVDSESNLARRVSDLIMRSVRAGTQLGTT